MFEDLTISRFDAPNSSESGIDVTRASFTNMNFANKSSKMANQGNVHINGPQNIYNIDFTKAESYTGVPGSPSSVGSFDETQRAFLSKLSPRSLQGRLPNVDEPCEGTLTWLNEDPTLRKWRLSPFSTILLVSGHAGCGKSVLASHLARNLGRDPSSNNVVCCYFFDGTVEAAASVCSLLRSLIHQMVTQRSKLLRLVRKRQVEQPQLLTEKESLFRLVQSLARHSRMNSLFLVIDAIDESQRDAHRWIVEHLIELLTSDNLVPIKLLITGRPTSAIIKLIQEYDACVHHLALENGGEKPQHDVQTFVAKHVDALVRSGICQEKFRSNLSELLSNKSEGTYLWVSLVCQTLEKRNFLSRNAADDVTRQLPTDLARTYDLIVRSIPQVERTMAAKTLRSLMVSTKQLTFEELDLLLAIGSNHSSVLQVCEDSGVCDAKSLEGQLNGLVKVTNGTFGLVHHTVKEHFTGVSHETDSSMNEFKCDPASSHEELAQGCMYYLLLDDFQGDSFESIQRRGSEDTVMSEMADSASDVGSTFGGMFDEPSDISRDVAAFIATHHPLFDYAARNWAFHFSHSHARGQDRLQHLALRLYDGRTSRAWLKYLFAVDEVASELSQNADPLVLACYFGHDKVVQELPIRNDSFATPTALHWASKNGHARCLEIVLSNTSSFASLSGFGALSLLPTAAAQGHMECVQVLLAHGQDINGVSERGLSALALAARGAHCDTISALLREPGIDLNAQDQLGASPLFWACASSSPKAVSQILAVGQTNPIKLDNRGRDALSWACEYGAAEVIKVLLPRIPRPRRNIKDLDHQTPLLYAVQSADLHTVNAILAKIDRSAVAEQDPGGRNSISWATRLANPEILVRLLKKDRSGANMKDKHGWTPLSWTLDPPERTKNAETLLDHLGDDFDDVSALATFKLALDWCATGVAQLLVSRGALKVDTRGVDGGTALSYATEAGHTVLVQQLLEQRSSGHTVTGAKSRSPH